MLIQENPELNFELAVIRSFSPPAKRPDGFAAITLSCGITLAGWAGVCTFFLSGTSPGVNNRSA